MYIAKETRYDNMKYNYCGASGLKLPAVFAWALAQLWFERKF